MKYIDNGVCAPKGFKASGIHAGIRKNKSKLDLAMILSDVMADSAAIHTTNKVIGAPNTVTKHNIDVSGGKSIAIICNSGNANTCNADGLEIASKMCELTATAVSKDACAIDKTNIIVASTGVIGQSLPIEPIANNINKLFAELSNNGSDKAASAIMTTDTIKKEYAIEFELSGDVQVKIGAIAKGSGMIHPNMATMLSFITTDVAISADMLKSALLDVVDDTFNMVSVDGDTSTNDMLAIMANGLAGNEKIISKNADYYIFVNALNEILTTVSKALAKDGEGATKLMTCMVKNASEKGIARIIAKSVITSNLLKCAVFASDANWGRILCAIGYADANFDISKIDVDIKSVNGSVAVCRNGSGVEFDEEYATKVLKAEEVIIEVNMNSGSECATAWGCDLTYDYVKINADYRT